MSQVRNFLLGSAGIILFLLAWEVAGRVLGPALIAAPSIVAIDYIELVKQGDMLRELALSLRQMAIGFVLACAVGMPLGITMGRSKLADAVLRPWVSMFVVTSTASLMPLLIMMLGTGLSLRVAIVFLASVWYITLTTYNGARAISPELIAAARSYSATRVQIFWKVLMPALYPYLLVGARIGLVHAIRAMVMAEMFVIIGYGGLIHRTGLLVETGPLLGLLLSLMIVSVLLNWLLRECGRRFAPWYELQRSSGLNQGV